MRVKSMRLGFVMVLCLFICFNGFSQLSEGGTPPGFKFTDIRKLDVVRMPAINVDSMLSDDAVNEQYKNRPYRFGYNHLVNLNLNNSGRWTALANGDRIWQLDVKTPGAFTINLAFSHFYLPAGAKLFVYTRDHSQVLGAFTSRNNLADHLFGTELLNDDEAIIEYYEPAAVLGLGSLNLFRITQGYKDVNGYMKSFGQAGGCINNVNCPQYAPWSTQKRSVVCLVSGGNEFCSGALVNNTSNDGTPYILTANHCGTADNTWIFRFNWEAPGCPNPATSPSTAQSITGGSEVANNQLSDFNLVLMSSRPPVSYNAFYAGWSRSSVPADSVTGIHHPSGDIKKCSRASNPVSATTYNGGYVAQVWQIGQWTDGVTEPGSSGSPLFDQNKRIIGQLFGGPSFCGALANQLQDNYGRFCYSWDSGGATAPLRLKEWLDPGNTGAVTNDGYDPNVLLDSLDAALASVVSPSGTTCNTTINPVVIMRNAGRITLTSATINYYVNAAASTPFSWTGTLSSGQSVNVSLPAVTVSSGANIFYANVSSPNGQTDQNLSNDSVQGAFTVVVPNPVNTPLTEGFEGTFPATGWSITTPVSLTTWRKDSVGAYGLSAHCASVDEFSPPNTTVGETPSLITPFVNMANVITPSSLSFDVAYARYDNIHSDTLIVLASVDCGVTWTPIYEKGGTSLSTAADNQNAFIPTSAQWRRDSVSLDNYLGQSAVEFEFQLLSGYGNITYIDNVNINGTPIATIISPAESIMSMSVYPEPFGESLTLQIVLNKAEQIESGLYSSDGKLVRQVINHQEMEPGTYRLLVNTANLSNGIYFLKLNNQFIKVEKLR